MTATRTLTDREVAILTFERESWRHAGTKPTAIEREFGCTPSAYYRELRALLDVPAALEHDRMLVKRLRRQRGLRRRR